MKLAYFLLFIVLVSSAQCAPRQKRQTKEEEKPTSETPEETTSNNTESTGNKYPFIPEEVQSWWGSFGQSIKAPELEPNKWIEDAGSFISKGPSGWFAKE